MKVLILTNFDIGLYRFRRELISELLIDNDVYISLPNGDCIPQLVAMGCKFFDTDLDRRGINPVRDLRLLKSYNRILKTVQPNLVITYTIKPNVYGGWLCRWKKIPYAANITGLGTAFQHDGLLKLFVTLLYKAGLKKAKVVFFENAENKEVFLDNKIVSEDSACLMPGAGVNTEIFSYTTYPSDNQVTKFLFMGRVMKEKGIDELFAAMHRLHNEGFTCKLILLGISEEDYSETIHHYSAEGWLDYKGYQEDVIPYIEQSHCFVLPSWHEGMANTNLECAAMGRPIITSNIHGCLEAVEDGVSGYLCNKQNPDDLYEKMKKFISLSYEERKAMGLAGRKRMEDMFDKRFVVKKSIEKLFLIS